VRRTGEDEKARDAPAVKREAEEEWGTMSKQKLQPWMRFEQAFIWIAAIALSLMVAGAIAYRAIS
jgi:cell division protein FtsL